MRYKLSEIAKIAGGRFAGADGEVRRVITDSRTVPAGDATLFVAIRTANRDGHAYISELYERGVRGFIVTEDFDTQPFTEAGFVHATDTVRALQLLAADWRGRFRGKVVGITGSYGKTVVKEWIAQLAPAGVELFRSPKSWNSQTGVALSLLSAKGTEDYIIIEAGISQGGEMDALWRMIRPTVGILTSVGGAHVENFASQAELLDEKLKLFEGCPVVIFDSAVADVGRAIRERYPTAKVIDASRAEVAPSAAEIPPQEDDFARSNAAIAATFWATEGHTPSQEALAALQPVATRLEVKDGLYNSLIINDTYNADIASLEIALGYLSRMAGGRAKTVILGEMTTRTSHKNDSYPRIATLVKDAGAERFVGIGAAMKQCATEFGAGGAYHPTVDDFLRSLTSTDLAGRAILIKGQALDRVSHALERQSHTTTMEIDLDALITNLALYRRLVGSGVGVMPMIKASGYGHGSFEIASTLQGQGVDYLAVAFADEGVALRQSGITAPIVVLNADAGSFAQMIRHRLEPEIYNFLSLSEFIATVKSHGEALYPIHIKLDTGMHRLGFGSGDIDRLNSALAADSRSVKVATVFSHLAAAEDPLEDDFTRGQIALFEDMSHRIISHLGYPVRRHIANTAGAERFPEARMDMVRIGIGLYGIGLEGARLVATLKTRIVRIAELGAGDTVGYNRRGVVARPSRIATIPIGYADGLNRALGNGRWSSLVGGVAAPTVGNICMDSCMIDITGTDAREGDEVVIFSAAAGNTVVDMAHALGTIPYEILTTVSTRVKRIYIKD
ncbi:MAG: alanine racemase [Rikenellaceae bacterium]|jgi:alanine racemase|nr:alanine racemase [Rikenellaceae bacterium]